MSKISREDKQWLKQAQAQLPNILINGRETINHYRRLRKIYQKEGGQGVMEYIGTAKQIIVKDSKLINNAERSDKYISSAEA